MDSWEVKEVDKYVILNKQLGKGNQATVFESYRKDNNQIVAAKVFDRTRLNSMGQTKNLQRQIQIQNSIKHPYILDCFDIKTTTNNVYFFMEYCDGGDLEKYLADNRFITESECLDLFKQIVEAFILLAKNNIVHRDLKPANILLKNGQLKIADFGFAKEICALDVKNTIVGSPIFMCPQALDGSGKYDLKKGDVWSAGVCLYLMLYKRYPFYSDSIQNLIETLKNQTLSFPDNIHPRSESVKDLLTHMLDKQESTRYTWNQVAEHKCLSDGSQYQNNPVMGSMEMNQISGISSFNVGLKHVQIKVIDSEIPSSMVNEELNQQKPTSQNQDHFDAETRKKDEAQQRERLKEIHCLMRLQSQFALIYRIIWKGFFQLVQRQDTFKGAAQEEKIRSAVFLLVNSLLMKENKFLRDLVEMPRMCINFRVAKHNRTHITSADIDAYFNSEIFSSFLINLKQTYEINTLVSMKEFFDLLQAHLVEAGFTQQLTEGQCNSFIEASLSLINKEQRAVADQALKKGDKTFLILILYLSFLQRREARLQDFTDPIDHYQKLLKSMEAINFMSLEQLHAQIIFNLEEDIRREQEEDNEEDDDGDDEEDEMEEEEDQNADRFT